MPAKSEPQKPKEKSTYATQSLDQTSETTTGQYPSRKCPFCSGAHKLLFCDRFKKKNPKERLDFVTENNLCRVCLLGNHVTDECRRSYTCSCGGKHSKLIHIDEHVTLSNASSRCAAHIPVVRVKVDGAHEALAVLDTASDATFCCRGLVEVLGLKGRVRSFSLNTLSGEKSKRSEHVNLEISSCNGSEKLTLTNVIVIDRIPINFPPTSLKGLPHLQNLDILHPTGSEAQLLIGQDNAEALIPLDVRRGRRGEPFAVKTLFGWSLNGPAHNAGSVSASCFVSSADPVYDPDDLNHQVEFWWSIDNDGLSPEKPAPSVEDKRVIQYWNDNCRFVDGHFQIPIPFKQGVFFPNNREQARSTSAV